MTTVDNAHTTLWSSLRHHIGAEARHIAADRNILLVVVLAPLVYTLIFGFTYVKGKVYDLPIAVVDYDRSSMSRTLISSLESNESLTVPYLLADESQLRDLMVREDVWGAVVFPRDMERDIKRGGQVDVPMIVNTSNIIIGNYAQRGIQTVLGSASAGVSMDKMMKHGTPAFGVRTSYAPVDLQIRTLFNPASNYALFIVPLMLMLLLHQVIGLGAGMSWAKALGEGVAPFPSDRREMHRAIIGRIIPYCGLGLFWYVVSMTATHVVFDLPFAGNRLSALLFGVLVSIVIALLGSLVGALVKDKLGVVQILFFTSMPLLLISGGSWPLDSMPAPVRMLARILPSTYIMGTYRQHALEGIPFAGILPELGLFVLFAGLLYAALALAIRKNLRNLPIAFER
jgi:ABC-2 type transport system permease protein